MKIYLVTGAAGFIGVNFVKYMLEKYGKDIQIIVLDKLTYAGNKDSLKDEIAEGKIEFVKGDIGNKELVENIFSRYDIDYVVNFAAESHVDRSILGPRVFLETNILGTQNLLEVSKDSWIIGKDENVKKVVEGRENLKTYGERFFTEETPLDPRSPYSSSKASGDMIVKAYAETYKLPINITRCSNNYGPYQFPEKLIPLIIKNILEGKSLPVYGDGSNVRDWLYVRDHNKAVDMVINSGRLGEVYNIGGFNEEKNINIVKLTIDTIAKIMKEEPEYRKVLKTNIENINYSLITYVQDRLGHDARYAIDPTKIATELGWYPETPFDKGIEKTIRWYLDNQEWVENLK